MKAYSSLVIVGLGVLLAGCTSMTSSSDSADLTLRSASTEWDRLYNSGNATALAAMYADDVVSMPPGAPTLRGRAALLADFQSFFAANTARHETTVETIVHDGDLAIERASYRLTYKPKAGGPEVVETGRHVECRMNLDGDWKIITEIWNTDPPPGK